MSWYHIQLTKVMILPIISVLLINSCLQDWSKDYQRDYAQVTPFAEKQCTDYGQKYLQHYYAQNWKVICFQESPYLNIIKDVKIPEGE